MWDFPAEAFCHAITIEDGNIFLSEKVDEIINTHKTDPPVLVTFDPIISFGIGESRVNDNEQGLIMAARRIRNGLNCAVRVIHHTGKANAREKTLDQYTSRGRLRIARRVEDGFYLAAVGLKGKFTSPARGLQPLPGGIDHHFGQSQDLICEGKLAANLDKADRLAIRMLFRLLRLKKRSFDDNLKA
jgi:hypothetical protein